MHQPIAAATPTKRAIVGAIKNLVDAGTIAEVSAIAAAAVAPAPAEPPAPAPGRVITEVSRPLDILTRDQAADYLGVTPSVLDWRRVNGTGPVYMRVGKKLIRYRRVDLDAWSKTAECANIRRLRGEAPQAPVPAVQQAIPIDVEALPQEAAAPAPVTGRRDEVGLRLFALADKLLSISHSLLAKDRVEEAKTVLLGARELSEAGRELLGGAA